MLTTTENYCLGESVSDGTEYTSWLAVNLELWIPYAFITHSTKQDFGSISSTTILWVQDDILAFCRALRKNDIQKISNFRLLAPLESEDGKSEWRWVQIEEVWSCRVPPSKEAFPIYVSTERERIVDVDTTVIMTDENAELLYRSQSDKGAWNHIDR